jgi:UDP-glucose 4-epimerase
MIAAPGAGPVAGTRLAVTGAGGFVGSHLSAMLAGEGAVVSRYTRRAPIVDPAGDLAHDLHGSKVVFYLATSIHPSTAERHPEWVAADRAAFVRMLDQLAGLDGPPLVVLASSGGYVYGPQARLPFAEDAPVHTDTAYGQAKLQLERDLADRRGVVPGIALRLSNVYGPGQHTSTGHGVIAHWAQAALAGQPLRIIGDPATLLDFVHVDDVAAAMCRIGALAADDAGLPAVLNIGSGEPTSLDRLLQVFARLLARELPVERTASRSFERNDTVLDIRSAAEILGWTPQTSLEDGLAGVLRQLSGT